MKQRQFYPVTVINSQILSPSIRRLTLQGESIAHFGKSSEGGYFKFLFNSQGGTVLADEDERPIMRTYTIRHYDPQHQAIQVDFVRHQTHDLTCGFAARWAESAKQGDVISIIGPGKSPYPTFEHDWVFFVADMTSLPAVAVSLNQLPKSAKGYAIIEVASDDDIQTLTHPPQVEIVWVIQSQGQSLPDIVQSKPWLAGQADIWCACEFDHMRTLRHYFRNERGIEKEHLYISSYWKQGVSEDGHKILKRQDMEQ